MLKTIRILFLGLVVCAGSACVTPTHASSASGILLVMVQASGVGGAKDERVVLHNNTATPVDVTNWCVVNKAGRTIVCLSPPANMPIAYYLGAHQSIILYSQEAAALSGVIVPQFVYTVTNQSSGSIVNGGDSLSLINNHQEVVDSVVWSTAIPTGKVLSRMQSEAPPYEYVNDGTSGDWHIAMPPTLSEGSHVLEVREVDVEPVFEDEEPASPTDEQEDVGVSAPYITELLANPAGSDTGTEFIELFNPHPYAVSLAPYQLRVVGSSEKWFVFPVGASIPSGSYRAFYNSEIKFTLANTSGEVQLYDSSRKPIGEAVRYTEAKDGESWALIDGNWQASKAPSPGLENTSIGDTQVSVSVAESSQKPCADNQYRNPETGRCKLISSTASTQTPCKQGQVRNPETGRCRAEAALETSPTPCKPGQERNQETNRCRTVKQMSEASDAVKGVQTTANAQLRWYYWAGIGILVLAVLSYGVWEWREELRITILADRVRAVLRRFKMFFVKRSS